MIERIVLVGRLIGFGQLAGHLLQQQGELDAADLFLFGKKFDNAHRQSGQPIEALPFNRIGIEARQQLLPDQFIDGIVGSVSQGLIHLTENLADITEGVVQRRFSQLMAGVITRQGGDGDQKRQAIIGQVESQPLLFDPTNQFGQCPLRGAGNGFRHDILFSNTLLSA